MAPVKFSITISSDPQYRWWALSTGSQPTDLLTANPNEDEDDLKEQYSCQVITDQYKDMNDVVTRKEKSPFPIAGHIINGDLTEYGHPDQKEKLLDFLNILSDEHPEIPIYPGLGNHDYENNVDKTWRNRGATGMVLFMYDWVKRYQDEEKTGNLDFRHDGRDYTGSMAYSFNIGNVHFVQLHNYPSYTEEWVSRAKEGDRGKKRFQITSSLNWLRYDLTVAKKRGDIVIVCLHDYRPTHPRDSAFERIVRDYEVSAVFAGHIHPDCKMISQSAIPFFRSGAADHQNYLVVKFDCSKKEMTVKRRQGTYTKDRPANYNSVDLTRNPITLKDTSISPVIGSPQACLVRQENNKIYFFAGSNYHRLTDNWNIGIGPTQLDSGYPKPILNNWPKLPDAFNNGIDAALLRKSNGKIYLFKGSQYVRLTDNWKDGNPYPQMDSGYPRNIAGNWPGMPDDFYQGIDAALWRESNQKIYLFKGDRYVRFTTVHEGIDSGYPKNIAGNWPGMPDDFYQGIDAALWRESNQKIYLFKGDQYVRFTTVHEGIDSGYPRSIYGNWLPLI